MLVKGQIVGGFVQGMGWVTTEELVWSAKGELLSHSPTTYKIPAISDLPPVFNLRFLDNPHNQVSLYRSKALGEPPLLLPFSVFFAVRDAVASVGDHKVNPPLNAPATSEEILKAVVAVRAATAATRQ